MGGLSGREGMNFEPQKNKLDTKQINSGGELRKHPHKHDNESGREEETEVGEGNGRSLA